MKSDSINDSAILSEEISKDGDTATTSESSLEQQQNEEIRDTTEWQEKASIVVASNLEVGIQQETPATPKSKEKTKLLGNPSIPQGKKEEEEIEWNNNDQETRRIGDEWTEKQRAPRCAPKSSSSTAEDSSEASNNNEKDSTPKKDRQRRGSGEGSETMTSWRITGTPGAFAVAGIGSLLEEEEEKEEEEGGDVWSEQQQTRMVAFGGEQQPTRMVSFGGEEQPLETQLSRCITVQGSLVPDSDSFRVSENKRKEAESERERLRRRLEEMESQKKNVVVAATAEPVEKNYKSWCILSLFFAVLVLIVVVGLSVGLPIAVSKKDANEQPRRPTLETVLENGVVRCGVGAWTTRTTDEHGNVVDEGVEPDLCRAIAAAVFGDPDRSEIVYVTFKERWEFLLDGSIDIVTLASTHTMERDVYTKMDRGGSGFGFTDPYFYGGIGIGGVPPFGKKCVDQLVAGLPRDRMCREGRVCTSESGTAHDVLADFLPGVNMRPFPNNEVYQRFIDGDCNAVAGPVSAVSKAAMESRGYFGPYETGKHVFSKDPMSMATRNDDPEWLDFANWVLRALKAAEERNITMSTASEFTNPTVFGERFENMFSDAIAAVGNYGEFYDRNLGSRLPREAFNEINNGTTGLIYSHPLGSNFLVNPGPDPAEGSTLDTISKRGHLRCGVVSSEWAGLDEDYCLALASGIFPNNRSLHVENLASVEDGFLALATGDIDVLAGGISNLQNDVLEPTTGEGFSFTQPYFYYNSDDNEVVAVALATTQKDPQWSDFVYWLVASTFYAEERGIEQGGVAGMPQVNLFGPRYKDMFHDAITAVGNYGDMYARNVESVIPRTGRNLLNTNPFGPQHFSFF